MVEPKTRWNPFHVYKWYLSLNVRSPCHCICYSHFRRLHVIGCQENIDNTGSQQNQEIHRGVFCYERNPKWLGMEAQLLKCSSLLLPMNWRLGYLIHVNMIKWWISWFGLNRFVLCSILYWYGLPVTARDTLATVAKAVTFEVVQSM